MLEPSRDPRHPADARASGPLAVYATLADLRRAFSLVPVAAYELDRRRGEVAALLEGRAGR